MPPVKVDHDGSGPADRPSGLGARGARAGDATLYCRPHDVELLDGCSGCIAGTVAASRRVAGTRRVELEIGGDRQRSKVSRHLSSHCDDIDIGKPIDLLVDALKIQKLVGQSG